MKKNKLAPYDLEYMKLAILKQEETFKQQVHELHRVYKIQRLLMSTSPQRKFTKNEYPRMPNEKRHMKNLLGVLELERSSKQCFINREQPRSLDHFGYNTEPLDLTLGLGTCYSSQLLCDKDNKQSTTRLLTSNSVMTFSSFSSGSSSHSKKSCIRGRNDNVEYHDHSRQQDLTNLGQPPWCLQVLSLNMAIE